MPRLLLMRFTACEADCPGYLGTGCRGIRLSGVGFPGAEVVHEKIHYGIQCDGGAVALVSIREQQRSRGAKSI